MPGQVGVQNYNIQQIFLGHNWDQDMTFVNGTGAPITVLMGTVMGTVFTGGYTATCQSGNSDGSERARGICRETTIIPANSNGVVNVVYSGEVNANALIFANGTDTLTTTVGDHVTGGSMRDMIQQNTDIKLINSIELSITDPNQ